MNGEYAAVDTDCGCLFADLPRSELGDSGATLASGGPLIARLRELSDAVVIEILLVRIRFKFILIAATCSQTCRARSLVKVALPSLAAIQFALIGMYNEI